MMHTASNSAAPRKAKTMPKQIQGRVLIMFVAQRMKKSIKRVMNEVKLLIKIAL